MTHAERLRDSARGLQDAANTVETTAYDLAPHVEKAMVAKLILIAADLERIVNTLMGEEVDKTD